MPPSIFNIFLIFPNFVKYLGLGRSATRRETRVSSLFRYSVAFYFWRI